MSADGGIRKRCLHFRPVEIRVHREIRRNDEVLLIKPFRTLLRFHFPLTAPRRSGVWPNIPGKQFSGFLKGLPRCDIRSAKIFRFEIQTVPFFSFCFPFFPPTPLFSFLFLSFSKINEREEYEGASRRRFGSPGKRY